ncbi:MAG: hypothetical protein GY810_18045 [Aureispira sp.]|nr:hypothetical protein [Aureispira sp.]
MKFFLMHFYTKYSKEKIKLASKPFASGGEGALYHVVSPVQYKHLAAKIYYPEKRSPERKQKVIYLINNPPISISEKQNPPIGWPLDILYQDKDFVGLLLPLLKGQKLTMLTLSKLPRRVNKAWHRFSLKNPDAFKLRLRLCFNIASTLYQIHNMGLYTLVDLKPDNILVQSNGLISIVDMDSVEVIEDNKVLFPAPVATPEYSPPEKYTMERKVDVPVLDSWDRFSMAVIFYQMLFGLHPFAASSKPPYDGLVGLDDKIKHGLFVHNSHIQKHFKIIPPPHQKFATVDQLLQDLFIECFVIGHAQPELRPTAEDWCSFLIEKLQLPIKLEGVNAILKLADNYIVPSSIINLKKILDFKHLNYFPILLSSLTRVEKNIYPFLVDKLESPHDYTDTIDRSLLAEVVPTYTTISPQIDYSNNRLQQRHFHINNTKVYGFKIFLTLSIISSLVTLSLGYWLPAIISILPGLFILYTKAHTYVQPEEAKKIIDSVSPSKLFRHNQNKESLKKQLTAIDQKIQTWQKNYANSFQKVAVTDLKVVKAYEIERSLFLEKLKVLDSRAKALRTEEKQAIENWKTYELAVKEYSFFTPYKSISYNYLSHKLQLALTTINTKIEGYKNDQQNIKNQHKEDSYQLIIKKDFKIQQTRAKILKQFNQEKAPFKPKALKSAHSKQLSTVKARHDKELQAAQKELEDNLKQLEIAYKKELEIYKGTTTSLAQKLQPSYIRKQYKLSKTHLNQAKQSKLDKMESEHKHLMKEQADQLALLEITNISAEKRAAQLSKKITSKAYNLGRQIKRDKGFKNLTNRLMHKQAPTQIIIDTLINFKLPKLDLIDHKTVQDSTQLFDTLLENSTNIEQLLTKIHHNWLNTTVLLSKYQQDLAKNNNSRNQRKLSSVFEQERQIMASVLKTLNNYWEQLQKDVDKLKELYIQNYTLRKREERASKVLRENKIAKLQQEQIDLKLELSKQKENTSVLLEAEYKKACIELEEKLQQDLLYANEILNRLQANKNTFLTQTIQPLEEFYEQGSMNFFAKKKKLEQAQQQELEQLALDQEKEIKTVKEKLVLVKEKQEKKLRAEDQKIEKEYAEKLQELDAVLKQQLEALKPQLEKDKEQRQEIQEAQSFLDKQHKLLKTSIKKGLTSYQKQYQAIQNQTNQLYKDIKQKGLITKQTLLKELQLKFLQQDEDKAKAPKKIQELFEEFKLIDEQLILKTKELRELTMLKEWLRIENLFKPPK